MDEVVERDTPAAAGAPEGARRGLKEMVEEYERTLLLAALEATAGNQRRAAAALGLLPTTLHEKLKRLGLHRPGGTPPGAGARGADEEPARAEDSGGATAEP